MIPYLLHNGEALAWLMTLANASADALIVDPPYASGGQSSTARKQRTASKYVRATGSKYPDFEGDNRDQRSCVGLSRRPKMGNGANVGTFRSG